METIFAQCNVRRIIMKKLFICFLLIVAVGCAKKHTKPTDTVATPEGEVKEEVIVVEDDQVVDEITYAGDEGIRERELSIEEKAKAILLDVYFDFDKYSIRPDARPTLDTIASFMNENKDIDIVLEGHCDERGTNEYNLALGDRRAQSTKNYLRSLGVSQSRIMAVTYGEEKPLCTEKNESCWQKNRRAHFVVEGQH